MSRHEFNFEMETAGEVIVEVQVTEGEPQTRHYPGAPMSIEVLECTTETGKTLDFYAKATKEDKEGVEERAVEAHNDMDEEDPRW